MVVVKLSVYSEETGKEQAEPCSEQTVYPQTILTWQEQQFGFGRVCDVLLGTR